MLIRSVKNLYPAVFQAFFRYFVSLLVFWPVLLFAGGSQSTRRAFRLLPSHLGRLLIIGGVNYLFQVSYAFYLLYPGLGTLIYQSGVIFSVLLAALFFPDERPLLHSRRFQLRLLASLAGVMLTVASDGPLGRLEFNLGVLVVLIATASCPDPLRSSGRPWRGGCSWPSPVWSVWAWVRPCSIARCRSSEWPSPPVRMLYGDPAPLRQASGRDGERKVSSKPQ